MSGATAASGAVRVGNVHGSRSSDGMTLTGRHGRPMGKTLAMILAGGAGTRLDPLTRERAKPAVPFGGRYRIIDFCLSNFVNSGVFKMKVLTQYKSDSLNNHLSRAWRLTAFLGHYVRDRCPAQMRTGPDWYKGTADAIYQNLNLITDEEPEHIFVFGADHVYRMDVRQMLDFHVEQQGATARWPPSRCRSSEGREFGIIDVDAERADDGFLEKPKNPPPMPGNPNMCLASMGNYLFTTDALVQEIVRDAGERQRRPTTSASRIVSELLPARAGLRLRLRAATSCPGQEPNGARLLARRGEPRRLLPVQHGPGGRRPDLQPLQRPLADLHPARTTSRRPSSSSPTWRTSASATRPTRWSPRAASSPAATCTTRVSRPKVRVNSLLRRRATASSSRT